MRSALFSAEEGRCKLEGRAEIMKVILLEATAALIIHECNKRETSGATHQTPVEPTVQKMQHPRAVARRCFFHKLVPCAKMTFQLLLGKNVKLCHRNGKCLDVLNETDWENLNIFLGKGAALYWFDVFEDRSHGEPVCIELLGYIVLNLAPLVELH